MTESGLSLPAARRFRVNPSVVLGLGSRASLSRRTAFAFSPFGHDNRADTPATVYCQSLFEFKAKSPVLLHLSLSLSSRALIPCLLTQERFQVSTALDIPLYF